MSPLALMVVTAALGVDFGWQPDQAGQLEFIIQIEPALLEALKEGDSIVNEIPPEARGVRRFVIRVGEGEVPRVGLTAEDEGPANTASAPKNRAIKNPPPRKDPLKGPPKGLTAKPKDETSPGKKPTAEESGPEPRSKYGSSSSSSRYSSDSRYSSPGGSSSDGGSKGLLQPPSFHPKTRLQEPRSDLQESLRKGKSILGAPRKPLSSPFQKRSAATSELDKEATDHGRYDNNGHYDKNGHSHKNEAASEPSDDVSNSQGSGGSTRSLADIDSSPAVMPKTNAAERLYNRHAVYSEPSPSDEASNSAALSPSDEIPETEKASSPPKPWLPLVITSLLLFASVGVNLYLGWMAWGFYGRLREKIEEAQAGLI